MFDRDVMYGKNFVPTVNHIEQLRNSDYLDVYKKESTKDRLVARNIQSGHPWVFDDEQYRIAQIACGQSRGALVPEEDSKIIANELKHYVDMRNKYRENPGNSPLLTEDDVLEDFKKLTAERLRLHEDYFRAHPKNDQAAEKESTTNKSFRPQSPQMSLLAFLRTPKPTTARNGLNSSKKELVFKQAGGILLVGALALAGAVAAAKGYQGLTEHFHNTADWGALFKHRQFPHHHGRFWPFTDHFTDSPHGVWPPHMESGSNAANIVTITDEKHQQALAALTGDKTGGHTAGPYVDTIFPKIKPDGVPGDKANGLGIKAPLDTIYIKTELADLDSKLKITSWANGDHGLNQHSSYWAAAEDDLRTRLGGKVSGSNLTSLTDYYKDWILHTKGISEQQAYQTPVGASVPRASDQQIQHWIDLVLNNSSRGRADTSSLQALDARVEVMQSIPGAHIAANGVHPMTHELTNFDQTNLSLTPKGDLISLSPTEVGDKAQTVYGAVADLVRHGKDAMPDADPQFTDWLMRPVADAAHVSIGDLKPGFTLDTQLPVGYTFRLPSMEQAEAAYQRWQLQEEYARIARLILNGAREKLDLAA